MKPSLWFTRLPRQTGHYDQTSPCPEWEPGETPRTLGILSYTLGLLSVLIGLAFRLGYATRASRYIDEFVTIWASQQVLAQGLPRFPTGAIYTQGLFYTYLEAGALAVGSALSPLQTRLPSLLFSVLTLALITYAARRLFHVLPAGFAALWLAVDSQAIIWGSRVRTYALLQFLVLAAFLTWYHGAIVGDRARSRWLAIGLLLVALVDQPLILLLLPPLGILGLVARGWGWLRQPVVWLQAGVLGLGVAGRWLLYQLMIPTDAIATAQPRSFLDLAQPFIESKVVASFFTDPNRLVPVLLLVAGSVWLLVRPRASAPPWRKPVLSLAFVLVIVTGMMVLFVGTTWRHPRYLYPLLPLLFLGAEGVLVPALCGLSKRLPFPSFRQSLVALSIAAAIMTVWIAWKDARGAMMHDEWGYDQAMAVVGEAWTEGDALATIAPLAAFVHLDHSDYLAIELEGTALTLEQEGDRVDGWTGLPLLDSPERLSEALEAHPRLWFVADEMRLGRHFSPEFLQLLWDRSDLVSYEQGVLVFRSRPAEPAPAVTRELNADFDDQLRLESYSLSDDRPQAGETVTVTLYWINQAANGQYTAFVHLVDQEGKGIAGHDAQPLDGLFPVDHWYRLEESQPLPDRHSLTLPDNLAPGRYRLEAGLYRPGTMEPVGERVTLDFLAVGREAVELPADSEIARFGNGTSLYLLNLEGEFRPGDSADLHLAWQAGPTGFEDDYTVFLHLLDAEGHIAQQWDAPPGGGWYPTSFWKPGDVVLDVHELSFSPMLTPGTYRLVSGLYRADGNRLLFDDGNDFIELAKIELEP